MFRDLVLARIIEPVSKADSARVLEEAGVAPASYPTVNRRLRVYAKDSWRQRLSAACARHAGLGPASLVLYDVSTLYFETDAGDGFRESGFSKERRLEPQITIGLLTDADGFPLMVSAFEGNKAETKTMLPVIEAFMAAHSLPDVTVVADAGMVSEANQKAIEAAGLSFILGMQDPARPLRGRPSGGVSTPARTSPTGTSSPSPGPPGRTAAAATRSSTTSTATTGPAAPCAASTSRSRKAEQAVAGKAPVKRNRFIQLSGGTRRVNRDLEDKARALAGIKGYVTNLRACPDGTPVTAEFVIGAYHQLFQIEKSFRMSKSDLQARPIYHRTARLDRSPPDHRVRRPGGQPLDRAPDRLVHPQVREDRPPLPHHPDPGRRPHHHRRRPHPRRPPHSPHQDQQRQTRCALA